MVYPGPIDPYFLAITLIPEFLSPDENMTCSNGLMRKTLTIVLVQVVSLSEL